MTSEEIRALEEEVNKELGGDVALRALSSTSSIVQDGLGSGSVKLNYKLSGHPLIGYGWGRIVEIYGPEQCMVQNSVVRWFVKDKSGKVQTKRYTSIERLYKRFNRVWGGSQGSYQRPQTADSEIYILSVDEKSKRVISNKVYSVVKCGPKMCYTLTLKSGKQISSTAEHKYFTPSGFKPLSELKPGDSVYVHNVTRTRKERKPQNKYPEVGIKHTKHPHSINRVGRGGKRYYSVHRCILVYEAFKNGLTLEQYVERLNKGDIRGIQFMPKNYTIHHTDENSLNDVPSNLDCMTKREHKQLHASKSIENLSFVVVLDEVVSVEPLGIEETYDVKCYAPNNNYLANDVVVHNSGKTTLALHAIHEAQKRGLASAYIDVEHALDPRYMESIGIDLDLLSVNQPDYGEQAIDTTERVLRAGYRVVVVDSVAALIPRVELEGGMEDAQMGLQARMMGKAMRKLVPIIGKCEAVLIFVNQIRMKLGVVFGNPEETPGGKALRFFASYRLEVRSPRGGAEKTKTLEDGEVETGIETKIKIVKNKLYPPFKHTTVNIEYGKGIDKLRDASDFLADWYHDDARIHINKKAYTGNTLARSMVGHKDLRTAVALEIKRIGKEIEAKVHTKAVQKAEIKEKEMKKTLTKKNLEEVDG
jgi:protein RecA